MHMFSLLKVNDFFSNAESSKFVGIYIFNI